MKKELTTIMITLLIVSIISAIILGLMYYTNIALALVGMVVIGMIYNVVRDEID